MDFSWIDSGKKAKEDEARVFEATFGSPETEIVKPTFRDEILNNTAKNKTVMVGASDPGRQRDSFFFVGTRYVHPQIQVIAAKRWLHRNYLSVEEQIAQIHTKFKFDYQVVEVNNMGIHVWEILRYVKNLPIIGVNTAKNLNLDPTKKLDPFKFPSMDKNDMARWMHLQQEMGNIVFSPNPSPDSKEIQRQMSNIVEYKTEGTGTVKYIAEGQEHDDGYMALMLNCWFIRENLMKPQYAEAPVGAGASFGEPYEELSPNDRIIEEIKKRMGKEFHLEDVKIDYS